MENIGISMEMLLIVIIAASFVRLLTDKSFKDSGFASIVFAVVFCFGFTWVVGLIIFEVFIPTKSMLGCFMLACINCFLLLGIFQTKARILFDKIVWWLLTKIAMMIMWPFRLLLGSNIGRGVLIICSVLFVVWLICAVFDIQFLSVNFILLITLVIVGSLFFLSLRE